MKLPRHRNFSFQEPDPSRRICFPFAGRPSSAFSLVEILVALGVIATLVVLLGAGMKSSIFSARKVESIAILRGYGGALHAYAADNGTIPGPLYQGQRPYFTASKNYLCAHLWPYFQSDEPVSDSIPSWLVTKHFKVWYQKQTSKDAKAAYMLSGDTKSRNGETLRPFGLYADSAAGRIDKSNWIKFSSEVDLSTAVAIYEAFATSSAPNRSPKKREIQDHKATLYFDGHVGIDKI